MRLAPIKLSISLTWLSHNTFDGFSFYMTILLINEIMTLFYLGANIVTIQQGKCMTIKVSFRAYHYQTAYWQIQGQASVS